MTSTEGFQTHSEGSLRILENEHLRVVIAPQRGGKLISLFSRRTNTEWLLPPLRPYAEARTDAGFENWDGGGFDECLPTVAPSGTAPDHGELWRRPWQEEDPVTLRSTACGGALTVQRRALLDGSSLLLHYQVKNVGQHVQSLLYSAHPLLRVEQGDRILLPDEVRSIRVEGSRKHRFGKRGDSIAWPAAEGEDLSMLGPPDGTQADKLFTSILSEGWCAIFRPSLREGIKLLFDVQTLPYVGLWICRAAWPESGEAKQYTVALEPASAPADALADAECEGTAWRFEPGQERSWTLRFALIHQLPGEKSPAEESSGERLGRAHDRD
jgi:galactose mutarotase-like enzyme